MMPTTAFYRCDMHIPPSHTARKRLSMTPLVDVIFLLLMFFMLSSTFSKYAFLELGRTAETTENPAPVDTTQATTRAVFLTITAGGMVQVNGNAIELDQLVAKLNVLHESGARAVIVVPRRGANVQQLVSVIERARSARIKTVSIAN